MTGAHDALRQLGLPDDLVRWSAGLRGLAEVWLRCPRGDWLLAIATRVGVPRSLVVRAAADCARTALGRLPAGEPRPLRAIEAAMGWARDARSSAECWAAAFEASSASTELVGDSLAADAAMAAASVAFACDSDADDLYYGSRAHAAEAAMLAARAEGDRPDAHLACAELVRSRIRFEYVASRIEPVLRSTRPPPPPDRESLENELLWFDRLRS